MHSRYIKAALLHAQSTEQADRTYYAEIPGVPGAWAVGATYEGCYGALRLALETKVDVLVKQGRGRRLPTIAGVRPEDR